MHRRTFLGSLSGFAAVCGALSAAPRAVGASGIQGRERELIVCGWDEVFILAVGEGPTPTARKTWSWRVGDSPEIPASLQKAFGTTDDCKSAEEGRVFISSSGGALAVIERGTKRALFHAPLTNAHTIEWLPDNRIAGAASTSTAGTGNRLVIFDRQTGRELASDELISAHGAVWDDGRNVLWALGGQVLRGYSIGARRGPARLDRMFELALPDAGGHDLRPIPGSSRLFVSTLRRCWYFDRDRREILPHDTLATQADIKCYDVHRDTKRVVYTQGEQPNWWTEHLRFQNPDGVIRLPGERLYKARWV
jgi:hypothetical protein